MTPSLYSPYLGNSEMNERAEAAKLVAVLRKNPAPVEPGPGLVQAREAFSKCATCNNAAEVKAQPSGGAL